MANTLWIALVVMYSLCWPSCQGQHGLARFHIDVTRGSSVVERATILDVVDEVNSQLLNENTSFSLKLWNSSTTDADLLSQATLMLQQQVIVMIDSSTSSLDACMVSDYTRIPIFLLHHNGYIQMGSSPHAITMSADYTSYAQATIQLLNAFQWTNIALMFEGHRFQEAAYFQTISALKGYTLSFIQLTMKSNETRATVAKRSMSDVASHDVDVILLYADEEYNAILLQMEGCNPKKTYVWIIQSSIPNEMTFYSFHMVVGFRLPRTNNRLTNQESLLLANDTVLVIAEAMRDVTQNGGLLPTDSTNNVLRNSEIIYRHLKQVKISGNTGAIKFSGRGKRQVEQLEVVNLRNNTFHKIGEWRITKGLRVDEDIQVNLAKKSSSKPSLQGMKLNIVTIPGGPFVIKTKTSSNQIVYKGFCIDVLKELASKLKFTYTIHDAADGMYGAEINGKWNGMIGELVDKKADMAVADLTITNDREKVVDFTVGFMYFKEEMIMRRVMKEEMNLFQFMMPFSNKVWSIVLVTITVITLTVFAINYYSPYGYKGGNGEKTSEEFSLFNSLWFSIACMLQQGADDTPKSLSGRVLAGYYWFSILIWVSTYTANLAAFLTVKEIVYPISDFQSAINSDYKVAVLMSSSLYSFLRASPYELHKEAWEKMTEDQSFPNTTAEAIKLVRNKNYVFLTDGPVIEYIVGRRPCNLIKVEGLTTPRSLGIAMKANDPHLQEVTLAILRMREVGYLDSLKRKWWDENNECPKQVSKTIKGTRIELEDMLGVYLVLGVGIIVAFLVLALEIFWYREGRAKFSNLYNKKKKTPRVRVEPSDATKA